MDVPKAELNAETRTPKPDMSRMRTNIAEATAGVVDPSLLPIMFEDLRSGRYRSGE